MIEKETGWIIVTGNPADGFEHFTHTDGKPFEDPEFANEKADEWFPKDDWWIISTHTLLPEPGFVRGADLDA